MYVGKYFNNYEYITDEFILSPRLKECNATLTELLCPTPSPSLYLAREAYATVYKTVNSCVNSDSINTLLMSRLLTNNKHSFPFLHPIHTTFTNK